MDKTITHTDFADKVENQGGCTIITVEAETHKSIPLNLTNKLKGADKLTLLESTGKDKKKITKWSKSRYLFGKLKYEDLVNHRLVAEAQDAVKDQPQLTFKGEKRPWGVRISPTLVENHGKKYLTAYPITRNKNVKPEVEYRHAGEAFDIKDSEFNPFRSASTKEGANQGTKSAVLYRDFGFESIIRITMNGDTYRLIPDKE